MKINAGLSLALLWGSAFASTVSASDLRVMPVTVEALPQQQASTLVLMNGEQRPLKAQIRVMRWEQKDGRETLLPTNDVVADPAVVTLVGGQYYLVRVVRAANSPIRAEEAYRILVDEVPDPTQTAPGNVNLVLRQSIPAFFSNRANRLSVVNWSLAQDRNGVWLVARNQGDRRLRLSDVRIEGRGGTLYQQPGLVGYVLPGAVMRWSIPIEAAKVSGQPLYLRAMSDTGRVEVPLMESDDRT